LPLDDIKSPLKTFFFTGRG